MKVILRQHIKGLGQKGDICEVSDGYAQNALVPKGLAKVATASELNKIKLAKKSKEQHEQKKRGEAISTLEKINGKSIVIKEKVNEKGTLYHALGLKEIINAIKAQLKLVTTPEMYQEKYALKEQGEYQLQLSIHEKHATLVVKIESI